MLRHAPGQARGQGHRGGQHTQRRLLPLLLSERGVYRPRRHDGRHHRLQPEVQRGERSPLRHSGGGGEDDVQLVPDLEAVEKIVRKSPGKQRNPC